MCFGVNDTWWRGQEPLHGAPTFPHISCNNAPNGDMFMNYMDYTDHQPCTCLTAWTGKTTRCHNQWSKKIHSIVR